MTGLWPAAIYAVVLWWFSTGIILLADRSPRVSTRTQMAVASVLAIAALAALVVVRDSTTVAGAFVGFTAGLVLWGWHEVSFLSGAVTGSRRSECPAGATGWRRFVYAAQTLIHHEIAIAVTALALGVAFLGSANPVGFWAFVILWGMRLSSKLNIFLGVLNITEEFLPARLNHLKSYFGARSSNMLFPVSVTVGTALTAWLLHGALVADAAPHQVSAFALLATLAALGVLEHWFMVMPLSSERLWEWALRRRAGQQAWRETGDDHDLDQGAAHAHDHNGNPGHVPGLQSVSARLDGPCDAQPLKCLLDSIAKGAYGNVERVKGIARSGEGWIRFDVAGGRSSISAISAGDDEVPQVVAIGNAIDEARLVTAFGACASGART